MDNIKMPEPIDPEEIDQIREKYNQKIARQPDLEAMFRNQMDFEIAQAIGRQRQEAIAAGGELGARIKAENDALLKEYEASAAPQISQADLENAKLKVARMKAELVAAKGIQWVCSCGQRNTSPFCSECGNPLSLERWICTCGRENTTRFCPECGTKRD